MIDKVAPFELLCREVATWCDVADQRHRFRTPELKPVLPHWPTCGDLDAAIQLLGVARRSRLSTRPLLQRAGRLLVCEVNESISSDESEAETSGFFDLDDRPPWDTWVVSVPRPAEHEAPTLISWVPPSLVAVVDRGIHVIHGCIVWLADADRLLAEWQVARALAASGWG